METTLKRFDMTAYIARRIKILKGELPEPGDMDEVREYTQHRIAELRQSKDNDSGLSVNQHHCVLTWNSKKKTIPYHQSTKLPILHTASGNTNLQATLSHTFLSIDTTNHQKEHFVFPRR